MMQDHECDLNMERVKTILMSILVLEIQQLTRQ